MKKNALSLAIGICLSITGLAQTQRTILYEEFTGESCSFCALFNPSIYATVHAPGNYPGKIVKINFQGDIPAAPGAGSLYLDDKNEVLTRQTYYGINSAPSGQFNGLKLADVANLGYGAGHGFLISNQTPDAVNYPTEPAYANIISDSSIVNAPFALTVNHAFNATYDSVTVTAVITAAQAITTTSLVLQVAMEEAEVHFANPTGTNGEKDFYDVMRKMLPSTSGTTLGNTWTMAATQTVTLKAKIPTYIHDKNQLAFVAFIQDNSTKRVHQAAYSQPQLVNLDASTTSIISSVVTCTTTIPVSTTIKNSGATTLTSCVINYKLDAGTTNTYTWTGSLAQGTSTIVALPSIASTAGSHTLTINTSLPNGSADQNTANDKKVTTFVIEGTPSGTTVSEGFVGTAFPPANWVKHDPTSTYSWSRKTTVGGYQTSTTCALYDFYDNATDGALGDLYIPIEDLTAISAPQLRFDYAYDYIDTLGDVVYDSIAVMSSVDCGTTWTTLWLEGGPGLCTATVPGNSNYNGFLPTSAEWKSQTIDLSAYSTANSFLVKFVAINHYGNNFYLDNVNLSSPLGITKNKGAVNNVKAYPNPASNQFNINVNLATAQKTTVTLYNIMGQVVLTNNYSFNAGDNLVNISTDQLSNGIYTVLVSSANGLYETKISVVK